MAPSVYISTNSAWGFSPYPCQHLFVVFLMTAHSDKCEVISHCSFGLHFPELVISRIFSCTYWLSACLLWKNIHWDHLPIFKLDCLVFLILNSMSSCVFWIWTLYWIQFAMSSPIHWVTLLFVDGFLHRARVFKFEVVPFVYLFLFSLPEDTYPPKYYWDWCQRSLLLLFF